MDLNNKSIIAKQSVPNIKVIRALKDTLDTQAGGYGMIPPGTLVEIEDYKARDLVARGIFEYIGITEANSYFTKVNDVPEIVHISKKIKSDNHEISLNA